MRRRATSIERAAREGPALPIGSTLLYATGFCSVTLGVGRRHAREPMSSWRAASTAAPRRRPWRATTPSSARSAILEARLSAARAFLHEAAGQVYDAAAAGTLDLDLRMRLRLATTYGMNEATDVSIACYRAAGTTAISRSAPFERRFRDAMSASQHLQGDAAPCRDGRPPHHRHGECGAVRVTPSPGAGRVVDRSPQGRRGRPLHAPRRQGGPYARFSAYFRRRISPRLGLPCDRLASRLPDPIRRRGKIWHQIR